MNSNSREPSIFTILWTDYIAFLAILLPIMAWIIYVFWAGFGTPINPGNITSQVVQGNERLFYIALAVTFLALPVITWRFMLIRKVLNIGQETKGKMESVYFYRDRGRAKYSYNFQGQSYTCSTTLHRTQKTKTLQPGDQVILMVDPESPKRAFIRDLYL